MNGSLLSLMARSTPARHLACSITHDQHGGVGVPGVAGWDQARYSMGGPGPVYKEPRTSIYKESRTSIYKESGTNNISLGPIPGFKIFRQKRPFRGKD